MTFSLYATAVLLALTLGGLADTARSEELTDAPPGSYARAHYDLLVVENCGLLTAEVMRGFELARDERRLAEGLGDEAARIARSGAGIAFEREWHNRGLGGSRPWCRVEGKAAALAFFARYIDQRYRAP